MMAGPISPGGCRGGSETTRAAGWEARLAALVEDARARPFAWGAHDCVTFAADAVAALRGTDPLGNLRGAWCDARGAARLLGEQGPTIEEAVARTLGPAIAPARARRGDIVTIVAGRRSALGVCLGGRAAAPGPRGLAFVGPARWRAAYPVGWSD